MPLAFDTHVHSLTISDTLYILSSLNIICCSLSWRQQAMMLILCSEKYSCSRYLLSFEVYLRCKRLLVQQTYPQLVDIAAASNLILCITWTSFSYTRRRSVASWDRDRDRDRFGVLCSQFRHHWLMKSCIVVHSKCYRRWLSSSLSDY